MDFTLNRDKVVSSLTGHTIRFTKGVATHVPRDMHGAVMAIGAVPASEVFSEEPPAKEELTGDERTAALHKAFAEMILREKRGDFSANNVPNLKQLSLLVGFSVDANERDDEWTAFQIADAAAKKEAE